MFQKLVFLSLCALPLVASQAAPSQVECHKKYGVRVCFAQDDQAALDQIDKACALAKIDSPERICIELETGALVLLVEDQAAGQQLKKVLGQAGYSVETIEVVDEGLDATVISLAQMSEMASRLNAVALAYS